MAADREYLVVGRVKVPKEMPALCVESPELAKKFMVTRVLVVGVPTRIKEDQSGKYAYFTKNEVKLHEGKYKEIDKAKFLENYGEFLATMDRDENGRQVKFGFGVGVDLDKARKFIQDICDLKKAPDLVIMIGDYYKTEEKIREPTFIAVFL